MRALQYHYLHHMWICYKKRYPSVFTHLLSKLVLYSVFWADNDHEVRGFGELRYPPTLSTSY